MYLKRQIDKELQGWRLSSGFKPLLLRGARQVGKTESVRQVGSQFDSFLEINFEENREIKSVFSGNLTPGEICEQLSAIFNISIIPGKTLLFFDEVQACPDAIRSLRFFYEKMPELHVIAAGSLLEFALTGIPYFGVGRIHSLFMYPMSFDEFLWAKNEYPLLKLKNEASPEAPLNEAVHRKLLNYLKKFLIMGGMPEVVASYIKYSDFSKCRQVLDDLIFSLNDDFAKYRKRVPAFRIREVFDSIVNQSGKRFMFSRAGIQLSYRQVKEALDLLLMAGLAIRITHTFANGLPLGAELNPKKQKILLLDTGFFMRILDFDESQLLLSDSLSVVNKGAIAEQFVGLELMKYQSCNQRKDLFYWQREAKNSNAEVDYIITQGNNIVPVEVKSGSSGSMQSMFRFLQEKQLDKGIRISTENFSSYKNIVVYPLYAVSNIVAKRK